MPRETRFRVAGKALDSKAGYVDVEVSGVDTFGNIYVTDGTDERSFSPEQVKALNKEKKVIPLTGYSRADHNLWTVLEDIGTIRETVDLPEDVDDDLETALTNLFTALARFG